MRLLFSSVFMLLLPVLMCNPIDSGEGRSKLEFGDKFQGDLILSEEQKGAFEGTSKGGRTGILHTYYRWPKSNGLVYLPYTFSSSAGFSSSDRSVVLSGLREIESKTCIRFVQRTNQNDYVEIINDGGCYSYLGRRGGRQVLSLARSGCVYKGTVMHEFIHALGYDHMHNRVDRDNYIRVYLENVDPAYRYAFNKVNSGSYGNFGTAYDLLSVMHYPKWAFSNNGRNTMVPYNSAFTNTIGANALSQGDITRLKNMYQC